ncbi:hypothetical protein DMUE_5107, partial [Dictyocoela muelleri]
VRSEYLSGADIPFKNTDVSEIKLPPTEEVDEEDSEEGEEGDSEEVEGKDEDDEDDEDKQEYLRRRKIIRDKLIGILEEFEDDIYDYNYDELYDNTLKNKIDNSLGKIAVLIEYLEDIDLLNDKLDEILNRIRIFSLKLRDYKDRNNISNWKLLPFRAFSGLYDDFIISIDL